MMVDPITNAGTQSTDTAERPAPGFDHAMEHALQKEAGTENALKPMPSKTKNCSATPNSSEDAKSDAAPTVVVPLLIVTAPAPQPTPEALPISTAPSTKTHAVTDPTAKQLEPTEPPPPDGSTLPATLLSDAQVAAQSAMEMKAGPEPLLPQTTPPSKASGNQLLDEQEGRPESAALPETPRLETATLSSPSSKIDVTQAPPTASTRTFLTNPASEKPQGRTHKKADSAGPTTDQSFTSNLQIEADDVTVSEAIPSPEPNTAFAPPPTAGIKPGPKEAFPNPKADWPDSPRIEHASPSVSLSEVNGSVPPQPHTQDNQVRYNDLPNTHITTSLKEPASAGSLTLTSNDPKVILPEPASHTESQPRVRPAEMKLIDPPVPGAVHLLTQPARQEMKFSWNTPDFSHIEVRTTVDHDRVGALVSAPDANLRESLRSQLDSLNQALGQHSLELADFQTSDSGANNDSRSSHQSDAREKPENLFPGSHVRAPALQAHEAMHIGTLDLRA